VRPFPLVAAALTWAGVLSAGYALSDELHQRTVPGRYFDLWDLSADLAGIGLCSFISGFETGRSENLPKSPPDRYWPGAVGSYPVDTERPRPIRYPLLAWNH
jgi:hypothetical protein